MKTHTMPGGLKAAELGFGCMSLFGGFTPAPKDADYAADRELLGQVLDSGVTLINTAAFYGGDGTNEEQIGQVLKGRPRDSYQISTKFGAEWKNGQLGCDLTREGVRRALEGSLRRLGVDYIDLWVLRGPLRDSNATFEETFSEIKAIVDEGKVKYVGLSEIAPNDIRKAHKVVPITALEMEWSLFARECETDLVPVARELGIGFLAYSPLGRGMLAGKIEKPEDIPPNDPRRHFSPRFSDANLLENIKLANSIRGIAERKGCSPGQLALAWVLAQGADVIPIPGTKRLKYFQDNLGSVDVQLTSADLKAIEDALPHSAVQGDRYMDMKATSYQHGMQ